jgi:uncharacterized protein YndB with AHSA1/START domain
MLRKIAIGLGVLLAVLAIAVATRPATFAVSRSTVIAAPPEVIFAQIQDLHRWPRWMSYDRMDPAMRRTYEGPALGVGSAYHYVSDKVGEGRMTVAALRPNERVAIQAQFIKPFAATNQVEFTLRPAPGGVRVTWAMAGRNNLVGKTMSLFIDMDRMIGGDFEKGLADLKTLAEGEARATAARPAPGGAPS